MNSCLIRFRILLIEKSPYTPSIATEVETVGCPKYTIRLTDSDGPVNLISSDRFRNGFLARTQHAVVALMCTADRL